MRSLALSQPEDSCVRIRRQCVLILLMLTVELPSRLLSFCIAAQQYMMYLLAPFFALSLKLVLLSAATIRETHADLKHSGVQQDVAEELPPSMFRLTCTAPVYI